MRSPGSLLVIAAWIPITLLLDTAATPGQQWLLGLLTTALLVGLSLAQPVLVRWQVGIVVAFATVIELVFSGWLGVYEYRLGSVPAYVPAGHGLVYLAALDFGQWRWAQRHQRVLVRGTVVAVVAVALYALAGTRQDMLGAFWALCLLGFLRWGRAPLLFVGAFWVVSWLEVLGTRWAGVDLAAVRHDPRLGADGQSAVGGGRWLRLVRSGGRAPARAGWRCGFSRGSSGSAPRRGAGRWWSMPRSLAVPARRTSWSSDPPASRTTGTRAAMSHRFNAGSGAMSTQPSATIMCDQKSP